MPNKLTVEAIAALDRVHPWDRMKITAGRGHSQTTWRYDLEKNDERLGKGAVIFTGPNALTDYRAKVEPEHRYVGCSLQSPDATSELDYLWRRAPNQPHPKERRRWVGEIGWGLDKLTDWNVPKTGFQIQKRVYRQANEDRHMHRMLTAWWPGPGEAIPDMGDQVEHNYWTLNFMRRPLWARNVSDPCGECDKLHKPEDGCRINPFQYLKRGGGGYASTAPVETRS